MAFVDTRIRSLSTARACALLGAHQRTIAWMTGLPPSFILRNVFDKQRPPPRGRPRYAEDFVFHAPLRVQAEASVFAETYRRLTVEGFAPAPSLIAAFGHHHHLSCADRPGFCFDEAFFLVANLDGVWARSTRNLQLGACGQCGSSHLQPMGCLSSLTCPFCKPPQGASSIATVCPTFRELDSRGEPIGDAFRPIPELDRRIEALRFQRSLSELGAHPRVVAVLTAPAGIPCPSPVRVGRPLSLHRWGEAVKTLSRAQYAVAASAFRRLTSAGFGAEAALVGAYRHSRRLMEGAAPARFDRCFEIVSLLEGLWGTPRIELDLVLCRLCLSQHLISRRDRAPAHCPFCLLRRHPDQYLHNDASADPPETPATFDGLSA